MATVKLNAEQQAAIKRLKTSGTAEQKAILNKTPTQTQQPQQTTSFLDKAKGVVSSVVNKVKSAVSPQKPQQQESLMATPKPKTQTQSSQQESFMTKPKPKTQTSQQESLMTTPKPKTTTPPATTPPKTTPSQGTTSPLTATQKKTTPPGKTGTAKTDLNQFYFGDQAKKVDQANPGYLAQRDQGIAQEIMADSRLTDSNVRQMVTENLMAKGADKMSADPADVEKTIARLTDMISAQKKQQSAAATLSSKNPGEIATALVSGDLSTADSYLQGLQQTDPDRYNQIMKAKQETEDADYANRLISGESSSLEAPEAPDYDTLLKESGLDAESQAASQVDLQAKYNEIYTPALTELGNKVSKFDTDISLLEEKKFNLRDDITKRLQGTGATSSTVDLLMYDEAEGINKEIRTLSLQRNMYADEYKQASASADAQWKAVNDSIKAEDEQKWKAFEKKYGIAKETYDKQRKLFENQLDRTQDRQDKMLDRKLDREDKMIDRTQDRQDKMLDRKLDREDKMIDRTLDREDMYTKQALDTEQMKLKYGMDYDLKKEMRQWDMEDKLTIMSAQGEQQRKLASYKAQLDKKTGSKISPFKTADGGYMFMDMNTMQPVGAMDANGNFTGGSTTGTNSPTGVYSTITVGKKKVTMDEAAILPFQSSLAEMKAQGLGDLIIADSYRTNERQKQLYSSVTGTVAKPGTSKHEVGMAVDVYSGKDPKTGKLLPPTAAQTKILNANGWKQTAGSGDLGHFEYVGTNKSPSGASSAGSWKNPFAGDTTGPISSGMLTKITEAALAGKNVTSDLSKLKGDTVANRDEVSKSLASKMPTGISNPQNLKTYYDAFGKVWGTSLDKDTVIKTFIKKADQNTVVDFFTKNQYGVSNKAADLKNNLLSLYRAGIKMSDEEWVKKITESGVEGISPRSAIYENDDPDDDFLWDSQPLALFKDIKATLGKGPTETLTP